MGTSLSIPRAVSQSTAALLQHLQHQHRDQEPPQHASSILQQHAQDTAALLQQQEQQQQVLKRPGSSPGLRVPEALQLGGGPTEQFLQQLQQELNKVGSMFHANTQHTARYTCCHNTKSCYKQQQQQSSITISKCCMLDVAVCIAGCQGASGPQSLNCSLRQPVLITGRTIRTYM